MLIVRVGENAGQVDFLCIGLRIINEFNYFRRQHFTFQYLYTS